MSGYVKLFGSILQSTIWQESKETRLLWITMLTMKDGRQVVEASVPGLARAAGITTEECEGALARLMEPDPYSRTQEHEGRRIEKVDGGWRILNGEKYRQKMGVDERREYKRMKEAQYRARKRAQAEVRAAAESREERFVQADAAGEVGRADEIAAEGLPSNGSAEDLEELARQADQR